MKLPRRQFLDLAAGATALPAISRIARSQTYPALEAIPKTASDALNPPATSAGTFSIAPGREFAANSYVHKPLAPNAPIDPNSAAWVAELTRQVNTYSAGVVCVVSGEAPIYIVGPDQPTVKVIATSGDANAPILQARLLAVPMPDPDHFVVQDPGDDHSVVIYQPSTKTCWELWIAQKTGAKTTDSTGRLVDEWGARWGGRMDNIDQNPGWWSNNFGASGSGLPLIAGYMTVNDLVHKRKIEHPIYLCVYATLAEHWSLPAQRTDGGNYGRQHFPDGTRFRLDASLTDADIASLASSEVWRIVLTAIRDYGMIVRDKGGGVVVYAENGANPAYGGVDPYLPAAPDNNSYCTTWKYFPVDKLVALKTTMRP